MTPEQRADKLVGRYRDVLGDRYADMMVVDVRDAIRAVERATLRKVATLGRERAEALAATGQTRVSVALLRFVVDDLRDLTRHPRAKG